jgi:hypothetical protein
MRIAAHPVGWAVLAALAPAAAAAPPAVPLPCGVADVAGRTGFLANPDGGVDAVDLATGDLLWDTKDARRPLLAADDRLFAWAPAKANSLRVVVLDLTHKGKRLLESDPVVLPDGVNLEEATCRSFVTRARLEKDRLTLEWETRADGSKSRTAGGQATIDVETGKVETAATDKPFTPAAAALPKELEKAVVRWQGTAADGRAAALALDEADGRQTLSLWTWDPAGGTVGPPKELLAGRRLLTLATIDGRHLLLRDAAAVADGEGPDERKKSGWSVFAVDGGERVAEAPYEAGTHAAAVVGPHAFFLTAGPIKAPIDKPFVQPRVLKAVDLATGKPLWARPVEGKPCAPPPPSGVPGP